MRFSRVAFCQVAESRHVTILNLVTFSVTNSNLARNRIIFNDLTVTKTAEASLQRLCAKRGFEVA